MNDDSEAIESLEEELRWLKSKIRRQPDLWALSRIPEVEGMLASYREEAAQIVTRQIISKLQSGR